MIFMLGIYNFCCLKNPGAEIKRFETQSDPDSGLQIVGRFFAHRPDLTKLAAASSTAEGNLLFDERSHNSTLGNKTDDSKEKFGCRSRLIPVKLYLLGLTFFRLPNVTTK
jgi:hypothetical protein